MFANVFFLKPSASYLSDTMAWSSPLIACYTYLYMVRQTFRASTTYCCVASGYYMRGLWIIYAWPIRLITLLV